MNRFERTAVLLTGAASGIGRATALRLASEGAAVFAVDLSQDGLRETADLLPPRHRANPSRTATPS
ncbi:SDR family NAD(P)-dependent oxidoreductase [Streptomyces sp. NPDC058330]|uniref:SDR family NAD(P)-dependent oxidoreductase n=1 Tax=Streptomyces sp. NPDC058330 TaxID=3346449 RepID=UPI0036F161C6